MAQIQALILIPLIIEEENFELVTPKEAGLPLWRRILRGGRMIKRKVSTLVVNAGMRTFYKLDSVPSVFEKVTLPIIVQGKERVISLVVTKVTPPPYRNPSRPFIIRTAFDLGFPRERMEVCSERRGGSGVEPTYAWNFGHGLRFGELWKEILHDRTTGLTRWYKKKTIPVETI